MANLNDGFADFIIQGNVGVDDSLQIIKSKEDPDGIGEVSYDWQISDNSNDWETISKNETYKIRKNDQGKR